MPCKTRVVMYRNKKETNFLIILKFFQIYLFHVLFSPHVCVPHMCMVSMELEEGSRSTALGLTRGCEPSCGWQESNLGSLKGQSCWPISLQLFVMLICSNCKEIFIYKSFHVNYRGSGLFCSVCLCVPVCLTLAAVYVHACGHVHRCAVHVSAVLAVRQNLGKAWFGIGGHV